MIIDKIENSEIYLNMHPFMKDAFNFLEQCSNGEIKEGRHAIKGDEIYALVLSYDSKEKEKLQYETHDNYIDIQCMIKGNEYQMYESRDELKEISPYNSEKDITFYTYDNKGSKLHLTEGTFAIYFPNDGHMPGIPSWSKQRCTRVVVKIRC